MNATFRPVAFALRGLLAVLGISAFGVPAGAASSGLVLATRSLSGVPYAAVSTADGRFVFVSVSGRNVTERAYVDVLARTPTGFGKIGLRVELRSARALGLALLPDESALIVAVENGLALVDTRHGRIGRTPTRYVTVHGGAGTTGVVARRDGRFVYVSEEGRSAVAVFAVRHRRDGTSEARLLGEIPVAGAPGDLVLASRGDVLYVASRGLRESGVPASVATCVPGALTAVDTRRAERDPRHAVFARVVTGCAPAQLALTADDATLWVALRSERLVIAYDTRRMRSDPAHAASKRIAAEPGPAALALIGDGALVVANTNRFDPSVTGSSATFFDVRGEPAVINGFRTAADPVRFASSPDGRWLYLTNARSQTIQLIDVTHAVQPGE